MNVVFFNKELEIHCLYFLKKGTMDVIYLFCFVLRKTLLGSIRETINHFNIYTIGHVECEVVSKLIFLL